MMVANPFTSSAVPVKVWPAFNIVVDEFGLLTKDAKVVCWFPQAEKELDIKNSLHD
jgi:hypothetical protein